LLQGLDDRGDSRFLLADGDVDADDRVSVPQYCFWLMIASMRRGLAGLAIADDELALTTADGNHAVDGLHAELHRLGDGLTGGNARGDDVDLAGLRRLNGRAAVDRTTERIDHAAKQGLTDRDLEESAGRADGVAFAHLVALAEQHRTDGLRLQVHDLAGDRAVLPLEGEELAGHALGQAVNAGDTVADLDHLADVRDFELARELLDLPLDDGSDLVGLDLHGCDPFVPLNRRGGCSSMVLSRAGSLGVTGLLEAWGKALAWVGSGKVRHTVGGPHRSRCDEALLRH
jgi:hypothetical protein